MVRVRLSADVDAELRRRVRIAAASSDRTVSEWIEGAVRRELEREAEIDSEEEQEYYPSEGGKPTGLEDAPRPKSGRTVADAVIEDRR